MAATKGAKVYEFPAGGRSRPGAFKSGGLKDSTASRGMSGETCIAILNAIAPVPGSLKSLLAIPDGMHSVGTSSTSLSSEAGKGVMALAGYFLHGAPFPEGLPSYGIHMANSGSSTFAILYDSNRRIIVCEAVRNAYGDEGSWSDFESSLDSAQYQADMLRRQGRDFKFVTVRDGISETR